MAKVRSVNAKRPKVETTARGNATKHVTYAHRKETISDEQEDEQFETIVFPPGVEPAFVRFGIGQTYNMQNFNMLRIDVAVTMPCLPADVDKTMREVSDYCVQKLNEEEDQWLPRNRGGK